MPLEEREVRANRLRNLIEQEDIAGWMCNQLAMIEKLRL